MATVHDEDAAHLVDALNEKGYSVTKLATTGGFLRSGNTTLICGVKDDKLENLVSIIESKCRSHRRIIATDASHMSAAEYCLPSPVEVDLGGATVFVMNMEELRKL